MREFDYCERLDASFWAEPLNAISNIFFLIAAYFLYRSLKKHSVAPSMRAFIWLLMLILISIGIGSFLWHSFASPWAELADVIPITLFIYSYLFVFVVKVLKHSYLMAIISLALFTLFNTLVSMSFTPTTFNGSIFYFPPLIVLILLAYLIKKEEEFTLLLIAIGIFSFSIVFRSIDFVVCDVFRFGTHFLWHILNAYMLYLLVQLLILKKRLR